jgi:HK97 family phage major capsid protein
MSDGRERAPREETHYRAATLGLVPNDGTRAESDADVTLSFSSEAPVERYDWWTDERYVEVLSHRAEDIDMAYAQDGLPLLTDHDTRQQVGILEAVALDADGKMRGAPRFSRSQRGQEIAQDVRDRIRRNVSVGYRTLDYTVEGTRDGLQVRRYRWQPHEVSLVPVPADIAVGVGRDARGTMRAPRQEVVPNDHAAPQAEERTTVSEQNTAAPAQGAATPTVSVGEDKSAEYRDMAILAQNNGTPEKVADWIGRGLTLAQARAELFDALVAEVRAKPATPPVQLTEKEAKEFSFSRLIAAAVSGETSFETEISEELARKAPNGYQQRGGFFFPTNLPMYGMTRTSHSAGQRSVVFNNSTSGGAVVFDAPGTFIDLLRNAAMTLRAGVTFLPGLTQPITLPKQNAAASGSWVGENPTAGVSASSLTLTTVALTPKTYMATTAVTKQLLRQQGNFDIEAIIRDDLVRVHALAIDAAVIAGTGTLQPTGILTASNVNSYTLGTNGGTAEYSTWVNMEYEVENDNADIGPTAFIMTPGLKKQQKLTQQFATTNGVPVWLGGNPGVVDGHPAYSTKQMPSNLTKGTSTTVCHSAIYGVWSQALLGEWGMAEILVDPFTNKTKGLIDVTSFQMVDVALRYPEAFCKLVDALV